MLNNHLKHLQNNRVSIIQWKKLGDQVANNIYNFPIVIGDDTKDLENLRLVNS